MYLYIYLKNKFKSKRCTVLKYYCTKVLIKLFWACPAPSNSNRKELLRAEM